VFLNLIQRTKEMDRAWSFDRVEPTGREFALLEHGDQFYIDGIAWRITAKNHEVGVFYVRSWQGAYNCFNDWIVTGAHADLEAALLEAERRRAAEIAEIPYVEYSGISHEIHQIVLGSKDYAEQRELRNGVLRKPIGLDDELDPPESEASHLHFGLFRHFEQPSVWNEGQIDRPLASCVIGEPVSDKTIKLRQMATTPSCQGQGLGTVLLTHVERELYKLGYRHVILHAREMAMSFYGKMGYRRVGKPFLEVGLNHQRMEKELSDKTPSPHAGDRVDEMTPE